MRKLKLLNSYKVAVSGTSTSEVINFVSGTLLRFVLTIRIALLLLNADSMWLFFIIRHQFVCCRPAMIKCQSLAFPPFTGLILVPNAQLSLFFPIV